MTKRSYRPRNKWWGSEY